MNETAKTAETAKERRVKVVVMRKLKTSGGETLSPAEEPVMMSRADAEHFININPPAVKLVL